MQDTKEIFKKIKKCSDDEVEMYFLRAENFLLGETNRTKLNAALEKLQLELAIIFYNREGMEGESSRNEGGISISINDLPNSMQRIINQNVLARVGGHAFEKK